MHYINHPETAMVMVDFLQFLGMQLQGNNGWIKHDFSTYFGKVRSINLPVSGSYVAVVGAVPYIVYTEVLWHLALQQALTQPLLASNKQYT